MGSANATFVDVVVKRNHEIIRNVTIVQESTCPSNNVFYKIH